MKLIILFIVTNFAYASDIHYKNDQYEDQNATVTIEDIESTVLKSKQTVLEIEDENIDPGLENSPRPDSAESDISNE